MMVLQDFWSMRSPLRPCSTNVDRISSLPDHLLSRILSFLPTKAAAATSVLSRRWRHVFTYVTSLDFDDFPICLCVCGLPRDDRFSTFRIFVDSVLQAHKSNYLSKFRLRFGQPELIFTGSFFCCEKPCFPKLKPVHVNAWMRFPLTRGVKELDLHFRVRKPWKMPWAIFTTETLEVLKLDVNLDINPYVPIHLPNLKVFHLSAFCPIDELVTQLVSSCLSLEDLFVRSYRREHVDQFVNISSPSLRRLYLALEDHYTNRDTPAKAVVLDTPNLLYFTYVDSMLAQLISGTSMNDLVEAVIDPYYYTGCNKETAFQQMLNLLRLSSKAQRLSLVDWSLLALNYDDIEGKLPVFHQLKNLRLGPGLMDMGRPEFLRLLLELLYCSPFLETLHFSQGFFGSTNPYFEEKPEWDSQCCKITGPIPSCCRSYLKKIVVNKFCGTAEELKLLEFLLRHALVLEDLRVYGTPTEELENKLKMIPRASVDCSIMFYLEASIDEECV